MEPATSKRDQLDSLLRDQDVTIQNLGLSIAACESELERAQQKGLSRWKIAELVDRLEDLRRAKSIWIDLGDVDSEDEEANEEEIEELVSAFHTKLREEDLLHLESIKELQALVASVSKEKQGFESRKAAKKVAAKEKELEALREIEELAQQLLQVSQGREDGFPRSPKATGLAKSPIDVPEEHVETRGSEEVWNRNALGVHPLEVKEAEAPTPSVPAIQRHFIQPEIPSPGTFAYQLTHRSAMENTQRMFKEMFDLYRTEATPSVERELGMLDYYFRNETQRAQEGESLMASEDVALVLDNLRAHCETLTSAADIMRDVNLLAEFLTAPRKGGFDAEAVETVPGTLERLCDRLRPLDTLYLRHLLRQNSHARNTMEGKNVIFTVGPTRAGKSTTIFWLAGSTMKLYNIDDAIHIAPENIHNEDLAQVTSSPFLRSETRGLIAVRVQCAPFANGPVSDYVLADSPGFGDTDGPEREIAAGVSVINGIARSETVRILVIIPFGDGDRMAVLSTIAHSLSLMLNDFKSQLPSVTYAFTRTSGMYFPQTEIPALLRRAHADLLTAVQKDEALKLMLEDLLEKMNASLHCINPLQDATQPLTSTIIASTPITKPENTFVRFRSNRSTSALKQQMNHDRQAIRVAAETLDVGFIRYKLEVLSEVNEHLNDPLVSDCYEDCILEVERAMDLCKTECLRCIHAIEVHEADSVDTYVQSLHTSFSKLIVLSSTGGSITADAVSSVCNRFEQASSRLQRRLDDLLSCQMEKLTQTFAASSASSVAGELCGGESKGDDADTPEMTGPDRETNRSDVDSESNAGSTFDAHSVSEAFTQESSSWFSLSRQQYWDAREMLKKQRLLKGVADDDSISSAMKQFNLPLPRYEDMCYQVIKRYEAVLAEADNALNACKVGTLLRHMDELEFMQYFTPILDSYDMEARFDGLRERFRATINSRSEMIVELLSQEEGEIPIEALQTEVLPGLDMLQGIMNLEAPIEGIEAGDAERKSERAFSTAVSWQEAQYAAMMELAQRMPPQLTKVASMLQRARALGSNRRIAKATSSAKKDFCRSLQNTVKELKDAAESTLSAINRGDPIRPGKLAGILHSLREAESLSKVYSALRFGGFRAALDMVTTHVQGLAQRLRRSRITVYSGAHLRSLHQDYVQLRLLEECASMDETLKLLCSETFIQVDAALSRCLDEALGVFTKAEIYAVEKTTSALVFVTLSEGIGSETTQEKRKRIEQQIYSAATNYFNEAHSRMDSSFEKLRCNPSGMLQQEIRLKEEAQIELCEAVSHFLGDMRMLQRFASVHGTDAQSFAAHYELPNGQMAFEAVIQRPRHIFGQFADQKIPELVADYQSYFNSADLNRDILSLQTLLKISRLLRGLDGFLVSPSTTFGGMMTDISTCIRNLSQDLHVQLGTFASEENYGQLREVIHEAKEGGGLEKSLVRTQHQLKSHWRASVNELTTQLPHWDVADGTFAREINKKLQKLILAYEELPKDWTEYLIQEMPRACHRIFECLVINGYESVSTALDSHEFSRAERYIAALHGLCPAFQLLPEALQRLHISYRNQQRSRYGTLEIISITWSRKKPKLKKM